MTGAHNSSHTPRPPVDAPLAAVGALPTRSARHLTGLARPAISFAVAKS
ncbi:hypothetical protein ACH4Q6_10560 [Streptomyces lydicus]